MGPSKVASPVRWGAQVLKASDVAIMVTQATRMAHVKVPGDGDILSLSDQKEAQHLNSWPTCSGTGVGPC